MSSPQHDEDQQHESNVDDDPETRKHDVDDVDDSPGPGGHEHVIATMKVSILRVK